MIFTPPQIATLLSTLDKYLLTFAAHHIGTNMLSSDQRSKLKRYGIDVDNIPPGSSKVDQAFKFGLLTDALGDRATKNMSYSQLLKYLSSGKMFKLNALEQSALDNLRQQTYYEVNKFGEK